MNFWIFQRKIISKKLFSKEFLNFHSLVLNEYFKLIYDMQIGKWTALQKKAYTYSKGTHFTHDDDL